MFKFKNCSQTRKHILVLLGGYFAFCMLPPMVIVWKEALNVRYEYAMVFIAIYYILAIAYFMTPLVITPKGRWENFFAERWAVNVAMAWTLWPCILGIKFN